MHSTASQCVGRGQGGVRLQSWLLQARHAAGTLSIAVPCGGPQSQWPRLTGSGWLVLKSPARSHTRIYKAAVLLARIDLALSLALPTAHHPRGRRHGQNDVGSTYGRFPGIRGRHGQGFNGRTASASCWQTVSLGRQLRTLFIGGEVARSAGFEFCCRR